MINFISGFLISVSDSGISSFCCFPTLRPATVGWATMGGRLRRILKRLIKLTKLNPKAYPCLSSLSVQVEVGCKASFTQLVILSYKGMYLHHGESEDFTHCIHVGKSDISVVPPGYLNYIPTGAPEKLCFYSI